MKLTDVTTTPCATARKLTAYLDEWRRVYKLGWRQYECRWLDDPPSASIKPTCHVRTDTGGLCDHLVAGGGRALCDSASE